MDLYSKLPFEDVKLLANYLNTYGGNSSVYLAGMQNFLRYWTIAKESLYKVFGENFILKKEISYEKSKDELCQKMVEEMNAGAAGVLRNRIIQKIHSLHLPRLEVHLLEDLISINSLVDNIYSGESFIIPKESTVTGYSLQIPHGCKTVKMIGKIIEATGIDKKVYTCSKCGRILTDEHNHCPWCTHSKAVKKDAYEEFRRVHSLVLNQKKLKDTLCLSIHPLDYITMSDNDCGWSSCMQWMEDAGDYRLGTIEMMNSSCVVVAYLESKEPMEVCGSQWNNKRWRQLYVVNKEIILGNRQYPYSNDILQGVAINWLRDLCSAASWGPYGEEACQIRNNADNIINGNQTINFRIETNYMYNDIYDYRLAYVWNNPDEICQYELNISGPAICVSCGKVIDYPDGADPSRVECFKCSGEWKCDFCGDWHNTNDYQYFIGEQTVCEYCYYNEFEECHCCNERFSKSELNRIYFQIDPEIEKTEENADTLYQFNSWFNYSYYISLCDYCFKYDIDEYIKAYGPIYTIKNYWGSTKYAFNIKNISDEGFERGDLTDSQIELFKKIRDAESDEERIEIIQNF